MAVTLTKIAQEAGVSLATVSKLFSGDKSLRISEEKRKKIFAIKEELGGVQLKRSVPIVTQNILAPVNRRFSAGWVHTHLMNSPFIRNFEGTIREKEFHFNISFFDDDTREKFFEDVVTSANYAGLLLLDLVADTELARLLNEHQFPHVCADTHAEQFKVNTVCQDSLDGIRQIVQHLRELGHRRIGYLGPRGFRYPLFLTATAEEGMEEGLFFYFTPSFDPFKGQEDWRHIGYEAFSQYLREPNKEVTAFVCHNDWTTLGAIEAMRERGLVSGKDISLAGYDDIESDLSDRFDAPILTTVASHLDQVGQRSGELLMNQILHKQTKIVHERLPVTLVVRQTTGPCRKL